MASCYNCFIKYYGMKKNVLDSSRTKISLYMEGHMFTLDDKINKGKKNGHLDIFNVKEELKYLLNSFIIMSDCGIYHRDIKPSNILVTDDGDFKIIDFSVSDYVKINYTTMSSSDYDHNIVGTIRYMAPEILQYCNENKKSGQFSRGKADVFSLGLTIYEMISLKKIDGLNYNCPDIYYKIKKLLIQLNCEEWLKNLLHAMLNPDYHRRPSFRECIDHLPQQEHTICN